MRSTTSSSVSPRTIWPHSHVICLAMVGIEAIVGSSPFAYVGRNVGYLVIGGAVAYAALLAIIAAIIMLLAKVVPHWGSALIVSAVVGGIGWLLIGKAMLALQQAELTPRETVETLKEDATWMKQQIK